MEYCGYIGGDEEDLADSDGDIAVDHMGNAYIVSSTKSDQNTFPVKTGPCLTHKGNSDAFIAKVSTSGQELDYCGYIGGASVDIANGVQVDINGNAYISGITMSTQTQGFPVKYGPDLTYNGGWSDSFVAKANPMGSELVFCGYFGGLEADNCNGIALDESDSCIYIAGKTGSDESSFPVLKGPDLTYNGGNSDAFVAKINSIDTTIEYCGYIGGEEHDYASALDIDSNGNVYVVGDTNSKGDSFPVIGGPVLTNAGSYDVFVASVSPNGCSLNYCGYIGGQWKEKTFSVAVDKLGNACVAGYTDSTELTFPVINGPDLTSNSPMSGYYEGFVAKVLQKGVWCPKYYLSSQGDSNKFNLIAGRDNANRNYIMLGSLDSTNPGFALPGDKECLPFLWDELTETIILNLNSTTFNHFIGQLDNVGCAEAILRTEKIRPEFVSITIYFAYCLSDPFDFVSNPVPIKIVL